MALYLPPEPEVLIARQGWLDGQAGLDGPVTDRLPTRWDCAWFGSDYIRDRGAFALVDYEQGLAAYVGDKLRLTSRAGSAIVYVVGSSQLPAPIAVARRAFMELGQLALDDVTVRIEVLG